MQAGSSTPPAAVGGCRRDADVSAPGPPLALTPLRFLQRSASVFREKPAVIYGDRTWTYPEMAERVNRLASALISAGVARGDRVAYLVPNIPAMLEGHFAVPLAGAILVAINTRLSAPRWGTSWSTPAPRSSSSIPSSRTWWSRRSRTFPISSSWSTSRMSPRASASLDPTTRRFWPPAARTRSTGRSRMRTRRSPSTTPRAPRAPQRRHVHPPRAYLNSLGELLETRMSSDSVYLWTLPMFHCNGWCYPWAVTAIGGTHVACASSNRTLSGGWWSAGVTHFCAAPTVLIALVNHPTRRRSRSTAR